jgi:branched-chain amino acid transport system ATP-binding protein
VTVVTTPLIRAEDLQAGYGPIQIVNHVDLAVCPGEIVLLIGPNGAGKTTTLLTLSGELAPLAGRVYLDERPTSDPLHSRARRGLAYVSEERSVFMGLTTEQNLRVGAGIPEVALKMFPELRKRLKIKAGLLSGGEQQMLALGRALSRSPRVLLGDELSLGLAPMIVLRLLEAVRAAADRGVGVLLVEQHIRQAVSYADRVYLMRQGEIVLSGTAAEIEYRLDEVERSYFTGAAIGLQPG